MLAEIIIHVQLEVLVVVLLLELMTRGMPQPTENDANKVLYGDMTWKDASNITDEHINTLIDKKLGVIENGTY